MKLNRWLLSPVVTSKLIKTLISVIGYRMDKLVFLQYKHHDELTCV